MSGGKTVALTVVCIRQAAETCGYLQFSLSLVHDVDAAPEAIACSYVYHRVDLRKVQRQSAFAKVHLPAIPAALKLCSWQRQLCIATHLHK